jgi:hypothetical protein
VAEGVWANPFGDSRRPGCGAHGFLQAAFVDVVAAERFASRAIGAADVPSAASLRLADACLRLSYG